MCHSSIVQKASSIVVSGTHYTEGRYTASGVSSGQSVSGSTTTTSALAQRFAAPKSYPSYSSSFFKSVFNWIVAFIGVYILVMPFVALLSPGDFGQLFIYVYVIVMPLISVALANRTAKRHCHYMAVEYPALLAAWQRIWYCHACDVTFDAMTNNPMDRSGGATAS